MKITLEVNDDVAEGLVQWGKENFGVYSLEEVIKIMISDHLCNCDATPDEFGVTPPPSDYPYLFSSEYHK
jgi:hypothetical protein